MSYFLEERASPAWKSFTFSRSLKRLPVRSLDDSTDFDDDETREHESFRVSKKIKLNPPSLTARDTIETLDRTKTSLAEFSQQYHQRYLTEIQKYKDHMSNYN